MRGPEKLLESPCGEEKTGRKKKHWRRKSRMANVQTQSLTRVRGDRKYLSARSWLKESILWQITFVRQGNIFPH